MILDNNNWIRARHSNFFCSENMDLSLTKGLMSNRPGNMMITSEFDETDKVCSIWTKCDSLYFLLNIVMSFASGADHQASSAIVSKQSFNVKKIYTITFCSYATNFACFIKFWSAHHVPWTIWHLFLGYRGISIIRGKIVAFSKVLVYLIYERWENS